MSADATASSDPSSRGRKHHDPVRRQLRRAALQLSLQVGALLTVLLGAVGVLVVVAFCQAQESAIRTTLDQAIRVAVSGADTDHDSDTYRLNGVSTVALKNDGWSVSGPVPSGLPVRSALDEVSRTGQEVNQTWRPKGALHDSDPYAVCTADVNGTVVQAFMNTHDLQVERHRLYLSVLLAFAAGLVLAVGFSAWWGHRAIRPLGEALSLQRRFVADAAHELRTPLTLLSTRAQLIQRQVRRADARTSTTGGTGGTGGPATDTAGGGVEGVATDLAGLVSDAAQLTDVLEELLLAADSRAVAPVPVDLGALADRAVSSASARADAAGVELAVAVTDPRPPSVPGQPGALLRALTAVLDNSIDHAQARVVVDVSRRRGVVEVRVTDDGPGIDAEVLPGMFDRFSSGRPSPARKDGSASTSSSRRHYGLGLALVADVVDRHGGTVAAGNRTDGETGAWVAVRLPIRRARSGVRLPRPGRRSQRD